MELLKNKVTFNTFKRRSFMDIFLYTWNNLVTFGLFFSLVVIGGFIWLFIQDMVGKVKEHVAHWKL
jgi:hypothetical protein